MARVKDPETGKMRPAKTDAEKLTAQAAAALADERPKTGQATLEFCATCSHSKLEQHPNGPCIAEWEVEGRKRSCSCVEYWPERRQREEGFAVTGWNLRFGGTVPIFHKRRVETELWDGLRTGGSVRLLIVASAGPKGFKGVKDHGVILSVEENRPLEIERVIFVDAETGEIDE